ncbi:hypothetical protein ABZV65_30335 [Streptomyces bauhiniae]|uniref:hypothetical protein n=1 Tax=Streptomyces bauhiniae TaxID=2340725 RepID=UPI0033A6AA33
MTTPRMPARKKVSITLPFDLEARGQNAAGNNFSAYMEQALEEKLLNDAMREYARLRAEHPADDFIEAAEADAA